MKTNCRSVPPQEHDSKHDDHDDNDRSDADKHGWLLSRAAASRAELFNSTTQTGSGEPSDLCWPVLKDTPASKRRLSFAGKIFDAVPECAVLLERDAHLLGSCIIALPGG
jgi:hypothetical protein